MKIIFVLGMRAVKCVNVSVGNVAWSRNSQKANDKGEELSCSGGSFQYIFPQVVQ